MEQVNKILVIVDVQSGLRNSASVDILIRKLRELLEAKIFDKVVATKFILTEYSPVKTIYGWSGFKFSDDYEVVEELHEYIDVTISKSGYSCVNNDFLNILRQLNDGVLPTEVYLTGCDTDVCVFNSALGLFELGIRPIILSSYCTSSKGLKQHEAAIQCLTRNIGKEQISYASSIDRIKEVYFNDN